MAQRVQVLVTDDIDGTEGAETIGFALDGISYEIDLGEDNATKLREALAPYLGVARRQRGVNGRTRRVGSTEPKEDTAAIRAWAKDNGYEINDRGRVPREVREAYMKTH
ncbi:histone-like nucleoid-structuring protein Lsr2 [Actinacidiphila glaucinigra]|uniref:histone-like nucleoid-structuring protein Lsr2 n=1 Tax=Actinacidiphila glaucinigra TaxID=235986 RepID=UPI0035DA96A6